MYFIICKWYDYQLNLFRDIYKMTIIEKLQTFIILAAVGIGLLLGQIHIIQQHAHLFIIPLLLIMLYGLFLTIPLKNIKNSFKNRKFLSSSTMINFIWTPILAWGLGFIFLSEHPELWLGLIFLLVTPCTDWYLVFTSIAKGNILLSTSILPLNLILQVILLPLYLFIFAGTVGSLTFSTIFESVVIILFVPFILASLTRFIFRNKHSIFENKLVPFFSSTQIGYLALAIVAIFASQGGYLINNLEVIYLLLIPLLLFFIINFVVAQIVGGILKFKYEDTTSLTLTIIARNSPVALAIVVASFPEQPLIALALVIGPLIELPVLTIISQILLVIRNSKVKL